MFTIQHMFMPFIIYCDSTVIDIHCTEDGILPSIMFSAFTFVQDQPWSWLHVYLSFYVQINNSYLIENDKCENRVCVHIPRAWTADVQLLWLRVARGANQYGVVTGNRRRHDSNDEFIYSNQRALFPYVERTNQPERASSSNRILQANNSKNLLAKPTNTFPPMRCQWFAFKLQTSLKKTSVENDLILRDFMQIKTSPFERPKYIEWFYN